MNGEPNRVAGVCSGLPLGIQDLMWGPTTPASETNLTRES